MKMKFRFLDHSLLPTLILYTKKVKKTPQYIIRGKEIGPVIIIGSFYSRDLGLLAHEMSHVREWWTRGLLIHNILYGALRPYRLRSECKAYYAQWKFEPTIAKKEDFIDRIWLFYKLKYSREYVDEIFSSYFNRGDFI